MLLFVSLALLGCDSDAFLRQAPCGVLVVCPRTTPTRPEPILETPPAQRTAADKERRLYDHVLVPSPLDRNGDVMDPSGAL